MTELDRLPAEDEDGNTQVVVECPRGSNVKVAFDPRTRTFRLRRMLPRGVTYPFDWGFVPSTAAEDGDPLDAMVVYEGATWPGTVIAARPIGVVRVTQRADEKKKSPRIHNDRILVVPAAAADYEDIAELPARLRDDLERFFIIATMATNKHVEIDGWSGARAARRLVERASRRKT